MAEYKYGDPVIVGGKEVGKAAFDSATGQPLSQSNIQTGGETSDFMKAIQDKLLGQTGIISSTNSQLESRLNAAISGVQESATKSNQALELDYGRQIGYTQDKFMTDQVEGRAGGSGGIMNVAAYNALRDDTNKNLKDLEDRKQSLILQNDSVAAGKIADLQVKALEFQQQAQQQTFSNLLGMANFGIQSAQEQRLAKQQTFQEEQSMANIALQYGIKVNPGDTLQSVVNRAMPFASKEQQLTFAKLQAEINNANAQAAKALKGDAAGVTDLSIPTLVNQAMLFDAAGKNPTTDPEYGNLIGTITKAGKLDQYYKEKQKTALAKIEAEKKAVTTPVAQPKKSTSILDSLANWGAGLMGEKPMSGY